jgi:hypothetical protein
MIMKTEILSKVLLVLPTILFIDFLLMTLLGCLTSQLGFGEDFYCGLYCVIGKGILLLSGLIFVYLLLPETIKNRFFSKHVKAS